MCACICTSENQRKKTGPARSPPNFAEALVVSWATLPVRGEGWGRTTCQCSWREQVFLVQEALPEHGFPQCGFAQSRFNYCVKMCRSRPSLYRGLVQRNTQPRISVSPHSPMLPSITDSVALSIL